MPEVHSITTAGRSHSEQSRGRIRRYLITMGFRTACFAAAFFIEVTWIRILCLVLAAVLPIIAVLVANAGVGPQRGSAEYIDPSGLPAAREQDASSQAGAPADQPSTSGTTSTRSGAQR